jgi:hypothetical protein
MDLVSTHLCKPRFPSNSTRFLLVRNPTVMKKLRAEISLACDSNSDLTRDDLRRMPYLQNVLKESESPRKYLECHHLAH